MAYSDFPPEEKFIEVLTHYPQASLVYLRLWQAKDNKKKYAIAKADIKSKFFFSSIGFRYHLNELEAMEILDFEEDEKNFVIRFV